MRVVIIDYTGDPYGAGLAEGLSNNLDCLYYFTSKTSVEKKGKYHLVYSFQGGKANSKLSKTIKGVRYIISYLTVFLLAVFRRIDVIHIIWSPIVKLDTSIIRLLKITGARLVFTPHNVLPHSNGEAFVEQYRKLYSCFDAIILHGNTIRDEFEKYYPEMAKKIVIEPHGIYVGLSKEIDTEQLDINILKRIQSADKVCIFFGNMFYNKGIDYLSKYWLKHYSPSRFFLIIVGKVSSDYTEMIKLSQELEKTPNVLYINESVSESKLNALISLSDIVLMPYRHATMSGVVFKSAEMGKTLLCTNTGSITEYLNEDYCFVAQNIDDFMTELDNVLQNYSREDLKIRGESLSNYIYKKYSWNEIAKDTIKKAYEKYEG